MFAHQNYMKCTLSKDHCDCPIYIEGNIETTSSSINKQKTI